MHGVLVVVIKHYPNEVYAAQVVYFKKHPEPDALTVQVDKY